MTSTTTTTIPYTPTAPGWTSVQPRLLYPVLPHPDLNSTPTPALPTPARAPLFHTTPHGVYRLSTHLVPAAYPRIAPDIPVPQVPPRTPGESPADWRSKVSAQVKEVLETQTAHEEGRLGRPPSEKLLWNCLNRYVCTSRPSGATAGVGVTLFLANAIISHKETWETMLRALLDASAGEMVDEVWAWEAVQHGDAAILNAENLNGLIDWFDNARDMANFLIHYLPEKVETMVLPTRLPHLPSSVTRIREERGYDARKLVVIGHSFAGCTLLRVAIDFPKLFSSIVLVDPILHRPNTYQPGYIHQLVVSAFTRRDRWSSREEALQLLQKSPLFRTWHPDVLQLYVKHALVDDRKGGVRLTTPGIQEGLLYANRRPPWEVWELLEKLDQGIALRWIVPERPLSTMELTHERVWRRPANSTNVMFHFAGHLIPQEAPLEIAHDISDFLLGKYQPAKSRL